MNQMKLTLHYDKKGDLLELGIGEIRESYYDETEDGIFEGRDKKTNKITGFKIMNFTKKTQNFKPIEIETSEKQTVEH